MDSQSLKMTAKYLTKKPILALKYKSFHETYTLCSFALALGLIYPNNHNALKRTVLFIGVLLFNSMTLFWFFWYLVQCLVQLDIYNSTRNVSIGVIILLFVFKTFYATWKTDMFAKLLKQITKDLLKGNGMEEEFQNIYDYYINQGKLGQTCYVIILAIISCQFPLYAGIAMSYESLKSDNFTKHMVHEMELKYLEKKQYDSPYFELVFAYYALSCFVLVPNFAGFDGSFCIATSHLRLKLKVMALNIQRAFRDSKSIAELKERLYNSVKDHQEALEFYVDIQKLYGAWLFAVFLLTSFLISSNLYQIHLRGVNPKYTMFALSGVFHMYIPCYFSSCLIELGEEVSLDIYCAAWESWTDPAVRRHLAFIMARAQKRLLLHGMDIVTFNMESFVSLMQTSYSFFTLITR